MNEEKFVSDETEKSDSSAVKENENKSAISADLIRGHINTIILRTLYERDKYGYEIIEEIENKSHGQYSLKQPTLYSALKRLETQGYINAYWKTDEISQGGRRKYYTLTDSGREITEKNQAEWEYSRTVIDNLISDRSFDFSQPAPNSVDFKILKKSTSRVPVMKFDYDDDDDEYNDEFYNKIIDDNHASEAKADSTEEKSFDTLPKVDVKPETITAYTEETVYYEAASVAQPSPILTTSPHPESKPHTELDSVVEDKPITELQEEENEVSEPVYNDHAPASIIEPFIEHNNGSVRVIDEVAPQPEPVRIIETVKVEQRPVREDTEDRAPIIEEDPPMTAEQRRIVHENYLRLISEPVREEPHEVEQVPVADDIDTEKLIYNNKPETERDYRNLVNKLFIKTIKYNLQTEEKADYAKQTAKPDVDDLTSKANSDGLKINSADHVISGSHKKSYNRGSCLFKSSLIISIIFLLEFTLCLLFRKELEIGLAYPFVILAVAATQLLIFGVLYYTDIGKYSRKPSSLIYLSACIIVTIILIFIIFIVSLIIGVNFASAGSILSKIIIPCFIALNIPAFGVCFYFFSK